MNKAELIQAIRDELLEPVEGFWTNAELLRWINEYNHELTKAALVEADPYSFAVSPGGTALPSDCWKIFRVEVDGYRVFPANLEHRTDSTGFPAYYYVLNNKLYFIPEPDGDYTGEIWYYRKATDLISDTDTPIFPAEYHYLIVLGVVGQAKRKRNDPAYTTYMDDYDAGKVLMMQDMREKQKEIFMVPRDDWEGM